MKRNDKKLGKRQKALYAFLIKYEGKLCSIAKDSHKTAETLAERNLIEWIPEYEVARYNHPS